MATKRDFTQIAHAVFQQATGEAPKPAAKKTAAVKAGKLGGEARGENLSAERRSEISKAAAEARWKKP